MTIMQCQFCGAPNTDADNNCFSCHKYIGQNELKGIIIGLVGGLEKINRTLIEENLDDEAVEISKIINNLRIKYIVENIQ